MHDFDVFEAIVDEEYKLVTKYIDDGGDLSIVDGDNRPILLAVLGQLNPPYDLVSRLITAGAPVAGLTVIGEEDFEVTFAAPVHLAIYHGLDGDERLKALHQLINSHQFDINQTIDIKPISENLLDATFEAPGMSLIRRYEDGYILSGATLLHFAAAENEVDIIRLILTLPGIDVNAKATLTQNEHMLDDDCIEGVDGPGAAYGEIARKWACRTYVSINRYSEVTPLHLAAMHGYRNTCDLLLKYGAKFAKDAGGRTPEDYLNDKLSREIATWANSISDANSDEEQVHREYLQKRERLPWGNYLMYDSDSESEDDYEYQTDAQVVASLSLSSTNSDVDKKEVVAQFRGLHFYKEHFFQPGRKKQIFEQKLQRRGLEPMGMHSAASYEKANISCESEVCIESDQPTASEIEAYNTERKLMDDKLNDASLFFSAKLGALLDTGKVNQCFDTTKPTFDNRLYELIQRYVNSYKKLGEDIGKAPTFVIDGRSSSKTKAKWSLLKSLSTTKLPLLSTSDEPRWALKYATALVNYDKTSTFQPRSKSVTPLMPMYDRRGKPEHPYLGLVYISLHDAKTFTEKKSLHVPTLFYKGKIKTKAGPGGHEFSGYVRARERVFLGGVSKDQVKYFTIVRMPKFNHESYPAYYMAKYNLSEGQYHKFKEDLLKYGFLNGRTKLRRNQIAYDRTTVRLMEHVIEHSENTLLKTACAIASNRNQKIIFIDEQGSAVDEMPEIETFIDRAAKRARISSSTLRQ